MSRLDDIRARLAGVVPGSWYVDPQRPSVVCAPDVQSPGVPWFVCDVHADLPGDARGHAHAALIANAPLDLAFLLAEVERLTSERDEAKALDAEHLDECAPCHPTVVRALDEARREIERLTGERDADAQDAARWRSLWACERIRFVGGASLGTPDALFGVDFHRKHPARDDAQSRALLLDFVDGTGRGMACFSEVPDASVASEGPAKGAGSSTPKGCNRHKDCRAAAAEWLAKRGEIMPFNQCCNDEDCEDCFGS